jgi:hypothetical protein
VGDADAGVTDFEADDDTLVGLLVERGHDKDLATFGELDGITDEIDQDLANATGIAAEVGGDIGLDEAGQFEAFFVGFAGEHFDGGFDHLTEVQVGFLDGEGAVFDLGEVEEVIDDGEQGFAAGLDGAGEFSLLGGEGGIEEQPVHAKDGIHGGANFMTDVGEEDRFGAGGGGGFVSQAFVILSGQIELGCLVLQHPGQLGILSGGTTAAEPGEDPQTQGDQEGQLEGGQQPGRVLRRQSRFRVGM